MLPRAQSNNSSIGKYKKTREWLAHGRKKEKKERKKEKEDVKSRVRATGANGSGCLH
jgi:hypothetical protein